MTRRNFVALASAASLRAETSSERARKIIDQTLHALGGDGFRNLRTRTESGRAYSFYREQISGLSIARIYTKYLDKADGGLHLAQRQVFGKKQDDAVILTGTSAWEITYRGARPLGDERIKQFNTSTLHDIFYILRMRLNESGMAVDSQGRDVVENQPVEKLVFNDAENRTLTAWIHSSTLLPVKQSFRRWDATINDRREEVTRYTKYRDAGNGVMWPYDTQRERDGEKLFELYADKVVIGEEVPDSMFELPPGITVLKK
ncbi:MAG: hypothetical protein ABUS49_03715 [Acidobacteriota bacterium]